MNSLVGLEKKRMRIALTTVRAIAVLAMPSGTGGNRDVDIFPITDPSTASNLVAGYRPDRYLSHFGERFIEMAQEVFLPQQEGGSEP